MGLSPKHTSQVPLVLNQRTGSITPQYHVVFDDWFATVSSDEASLPDFNSPEWARMFGDSEYQFPFDEEDLEAMSELIDVPPPPPLSAMRKSDLEDVLKSTAQPLNFQLRLAQPRSIHHRFSSHLHL
jgi:hypothetical protein